MQICSTASITQQILGQLTKLLAHSYLCLSFFVNACRSSCLLLAGSPQSKIETEKWGRESEGRRRWWRVEGAGRLGERRRRGGTEEHRRDGRMNRADGRTASKLSRPSVNPRAPRGSGL